MALVRRNIVLGNSSNRVVAAATVAQPAPPAVGRAQVPAQPGPVDGGVQQEAEIGAAVALARDNTPTPRGEAAALPPPPARLGAPRSPLPLGAPRRAGSMAPWAFH